MLNEKMWKIANTIESIIIQVFPVEYQLFCFEDKIKLEDIVKQTMFECCKYAFDQTEPKKSLRFYRENKTDDSRRMMEQRTVKKIYDYNVEDYTLFKEQTGLELSGLLPPEMKTSKQKTAGYQYNKFQYWEIQNVHDMRIVDAILSGRLSNKNFSNAQYLDYMDEYDTIVNRFKNDMESDEKAVFSSLAMFTLEWKYPINFYYEIASEMEISGTTKIPDLVRRCSMFCGRVALNSVLCELAPHLCYGTIHTDSRMLLLRRKFIHEFVHLPPSDKLDDLEQRYTEALVLISNMKLNMTYEGVILRDWFVKNSNLEDWASVMRWYDVFDCYIPDKEWSNKRIRYVKEFFKQTGRHSENPEKRS